MSYTISLVAICPVGLLPEVNELTLGMGWTDGEFSVPLSADGSEPATHMALHAWCRPGTVEAIEQAAPVGVILSAVEGGEPSVNFTNALTANGLQRVEA